MCSSEAEVYADGSVAASRVTNAGQASSKAPADSAPRRGALRAGSLSVCQTP